MPTFDCPACHERARPGDDYLCPACWPRLPKLTREALMRRDGKALWRFRLLLDALKAEIRLEEIAIP